MSCMHRMEGFGIVQWSAGVLDLLKTGSIL